LKDISYLLRGADESASADERQGSYGARRSRPRLADQVTLLSSTSSVKAVVTARGFGELARSSAHLDRLCSGDVAANYAAPEAATAALCNSPAVVDLGFGWQ
jgi:hypothetical protein